MKEQTSLTFKLKLKQNNAGLCPILSLISNKHGRMYNSILLVRAQIKHFLRPFHIGANCQDLRGCWFSYLCTKNNLHQHLLV